MAKYICPSFEFYCNDGSPYWWATLIVLVLLGFVLLLPAYTAYDHEQVGLFMSMLYALVGLFAITLLFILISYAIKGFIAFEVARWWAAIILAFGVSFGIGKGAAMLKRHLSTEVDE